MNLLAKRNITEKNYVKLIEYTGAENEKYKLSTNLNSLDSHLSELNIENILELKNTYALSKVYEFKKYRQLLENNLHTFIDQNNIQSANDVLIKIKETSRKTSDLKDLLNDARIYTLHINNESSELPIINEIIAMRIAKAEIFETSYQSHFQNILDIDDENRAEIISSIIL